MHKMINYSGLASRSKAPKEYMLTHIAVVEGKEK